MKPPKESSRLPRMLSTTLATAFFSMSAVVLLLFITVETVSDFRILQAVHSTRQHLIAKDAAETVDGFIKENFNILEATIWLTDLDAVPKEKQRQILQSLLGLRPALRTLVLLNAEGRILAQASHLSLHASGQFADRLKVLLPEQGDLTTRTIGPEYIDPTSSEPMITMAVPVKNVFGEFKGTLIAEINLKSMWDIVDQIKVGETGYMYVSDRKGNLIAFEDTARVLKGENVSHIEVVTAFIHNQDSSIANIASRYRGIRGSTVVGTYAPLKTPDWAIVTEMPWKEAYREILYDTGISVAFTLVLAALIGIFGMFMTRRLAVPVINLTETATRIASGERDLEATIEGPKEVAGLAVAFNSMTAQLRQSLKELEQRFDDLAETEKAFRLSEERLRLALDGTSDGIWDWDFRTGHVYFSPRYFTMLGYEPGEFPPVYESWRERLHPEDADAAEQAVRHAVEEHTPFAIEFRFKAKNGEWRWILNRGKVVESDKEGIAVRVAGTHTDITKRKQVEEALHREMHFSDTLIDGMPGVFCVFDPQGRFIRWNKRLESNSGYTAEEIGRMHPLDFFAGKDKDHMAKKMQAVFTKGETETEAIFITKDGRIVPHHFIGLRIIIDDIPYLMGSAFDITERKRAEEALEKQIVALTRPLDAAEGIAFEDLFNLSEIQRLQDLYAKAFGVAALITHPDGTPITQPSNFSELCGEIIRKTPKGVQNCMRSDAMVGRHNPYGPNIQPCLSAGLCNAGVSIKVGGRHVANWLIGQVRNEIQKEEEIMAYARELGINETSFRAAYHKVPVMSMERFERLAHVLFELANQLSMSAYQNVQQARFIAERKRAEESLRQATLVVENSPVMLFRWKAEEGWPVVLVSQNVTQIGYTPEELLNGSLLFSEIIHHDDLKRVAHEVQTFTSNGLDRFQQEYRIVTKDGRIRWVDDRTAVEKDSGGRITYFQGIVVDITERKHAEEALRNYERIVSTSQNMMALINIDYTYEAVNESFLRSRNKLREEVVGATVAEVMGEEVFHKKIRPWLDRAFSGKTVRHREVFEHAGLGPRIMEVTLFPMADEKGVMEGVVLDAVDITETRKLEEQLMHSQRIESIGTLAGGVAHEINNPINGIMNYAQLIVDRLEEENSAKKFAREILLETQRIAEIVRNLLTFARHEKQSHSPAMLSDIVSSALSLIRTVVHHDQIDLNLQIPDDLPQLKCRSQQIQQVLMNLVTNARDALNERYPGSSPEKRLRITAGVIERQHRRFIRTTVEDSGIGIPPEIRDRIFDPFFTTKPKEIGTGLGLSISYGIVKDHGGELSVESEPERYTRFHMDLPVDSGQTLSENKGDTDG